MTAQDIQAAVVSAGLHSLTPGISEQFATYLSLLSRWNAKFNLTAVREPEQIVRRHFLESVFCAQQLPSGIKTLLDFGSGAGFPGLPIALCRPEISITLGESQAKKASFLREAVRAMELNVEVYDGRIEFMPTRSFDCVTLRAVDRMLDACVAALPRITRGGWIAIFSTRLSLPLLIPSLNGIAWRSPMQIPGSEQEVLLFGRRLA